ncbi:ABC transporter ATP-binding protein [Temperatibacter marinus]|uniref:ABC transporter ATP-binding protein n=1 Tax=Temperatibacter marinus TaxID=1456591 RepID=A0AA52EFV5_9PROT|nr:ABC transporter ATP-binding protein [Temperatibacter marinus]WND01767.1 ABC transporter ATP-binding protein [Temperatibacter marinus]
MTRNTYIDLSNVGHYFESGDQTIHLFDDLNLTLNRKEVTSIVGSSGAGKSSLLSLAAGLEEPKLGTVTFVKDKEKVSAEDYRQNIGFIFQQFHLLPEMDALNNLALPMRLKGMDSAFEEAAEWLSFIGLSDRAGHKPSQLSGGEQQRIAIARAFISEPDYIFADEPTGNLDVSTAASISDLMLDCAEETGCGLVLVTHSRQLAEKASIQFELVNNRLECAA